jgi:medium-chain acyl-[acyl-carrier-protein] hydrolase
MMVSSWDCELAPEPSQVGPTLPRPQSVWWLLAKPSASAVLRLICFPHAGGTASVFNSWHTKLQDEVEVYGVQLPGRANRFVEPRFKRIPDLVEQLGQALLGLMDEPFAFFGHSMGAVISFEITRWLQRKRRRPPEILIVSGRRAPHVPNTDSPSYLKSDDDLVAEILQQNGTPKEVFANVELRELIDRDPLSCPVVALEGSNDEETNDTDLAEWAKHTTARFAKYSLDGDHFFIHCNDAAVGAVRQELSKVLQAISL